MTLSYHIYGGSPSPGAIKNCRKTLIKAIDAAQPCPLTHQAHFDHHDPNENPPVIRREIFIQNSSTEKRELPAQVQER